MKALQPLNNALADLLHELKDTDIKLIVGGGFGIYLKTTYVREHKLRTLLEIWPESRSTNDIDLFLRPELLIASNKAKQLADAITRLDYSPIPGAENYQFAKSSIGVNASETVKLDILTGPEALFAKSGLKIDSRRVRPKPSVGLHAHPVNEVPTLEYHLISYTVAGKLSEGEEYKGDVFLPHPFSFLMMKLFALRDRIEDPTNDWGGYHALDLYSIVATTTEEEFTSALALRTRFADNAFVIETGQIVSQLFASKHALGVIRLRESPYFDERFQLDKFVSVLSELFPTAQK
jgi:hypothetical protein